MTTTASTVLVERSDHVVTVTLNRPEKKNATNAAMWDELLAALAEIRERPDDRVVILTGAGGDFCSGADVSGLGGRSQGALDGMRHVGSVVLALHHIPKPTIAKVAGVAAGAGCNLALGCDLIVASEEARFSEIFSRRGLSLDCGGSWLLPRLIGLHRAKELTFFAEMLSAKEAADFGLVNRVVPAADLDRFVDDWAHRLAAGPPIALSMTKTMLNNSFQVGMGQALEDEARCQTINLATEDLREAVRAFLEKRQPQFEGR
jgi:2-(1,2-epoxy-1,2-dihydrophenyl)acetyl-CoA isomerase